MNRIFQDDTVSKLYRKYHIKTPKSLIDQIVRTLSDKCPRSHTGRYVAVDVGCGNGQTAFQLVHNFDNVYGYDVSDTQIKMAEDERKRLPELNEIKCRVQFGVAPAEEIPLPDHSVHLLIGSYCFHYFDMDRFCVEVQRILVDQGIVAATWFMFHSVVHPKTHLDILKLNNRFVEKLKLQSRLPDFKYWAEEAESAPLPFQDKGKLEPVLHMERQNLHDFIEHWKTLSYFIEWSKREPIMAEKGLKLLEDEMIQLTEPECDPKNIWLEVTRVYQGVWWRKN